MIPSRWAMRTSVHPTCVVVDGLVGVDWDEHPYCHHFEYLGIVYQNVELENGCVSCQVAPQFL